MRLLAIGAGLLTVLLAAAPSAHAQVADCNVYEIEAHGGDGGIDKKIDNAKLSKTLKKPPLNSWKSFKLLKKHAEPHELDKPVTYKLTTRGKLELLIKSKAAEAGKKVRLRVQATMLDKNGKQKLRTTSSVDSGDPWLVGGKPMAGKPKSVYFVGIACTAK